MRGRLKRAGAMAALLVLAAGLEGSVHGASGQLDLGLAGELAERLRAALPLPVEPEPPAPEREFPYLDDEVPGRSVSVGDTSHGWLVSGLRLEESESLGILPGHRLRDLRYGTEPLVRALEHAARALFDATGTRLWVGNLGRRGGGDIRYSVSHNSGRDADIAFCYQNAAGEPVDPPDLVPLNRDGLSTTGLRFDAARTWHVVKALVRSPHVDVQYLFIAHPLREQLLLHAKRQRDDPTLIERAAAVLRQPGGGAAHNDHLHLRIFCSARDVGGGCVNTGAIHPWAALHEGARRERIESAVRHLRHRRADQRRRALDRLVLLGAASRVPLLRPLLADPEPAVRQSAAAALAALGDAAEVPALAKRFGSDPDPAVRVAIVRAIGDLGGEAAGRFLAAAVGAPEREAERWLESLALASEVHSPALFGLLGATGASLSDQLVWEAGELPGLGLLLEDAWWQSVSEHTVTLAALEAAARAERMEPVEAALAMLDDRRPSVRAAAARALAMITNLSYRVDWAHAGAEERARGRARWHAAWTRSRRAHRDAWLITGFRGEGYDVPRLDKKHAWELVRATAAADHLSYNAQRVLMRLFDHRPESLSWPKRDACLYWLRWLEGQRRRLELDKAERRVHDACTRP